MQSCIYQCINGELVLLSGNCPGGCDAKKGSCSNEGAVVGYACGD